MHYTRVMTVAAIYPPAPKKILMIGLGGGSISTYLGRAMPDVTIDTIELDPGVVAAAKKYFGLRETDAHALSRRRRPRVAQAQQGTYDLILVDAFRGGYVPFHLLTQGILHPAEAAYGARRRGGLQRPRRHEALSFDAAHALEVFPDARPLSYQAKAK